MSYKNFIIAALVLSVFIGAICPASAHQPRIVTGNQVSVIDPEISKAYYGQFSGQPVIYRIESSNSFHLYVNVLVPDIVGQKKNVTAVITRDGDIAHPVAVLDGFSVDWKPFFEPYSHDRYFQGGEYRAEVGPGMYEVRVTAPYSIGKYVLAIGETESFTAPEIVNALTIVPLIKKDFLVESPATFALSPWGAGYVAMMLLMAGVLGWTIRLSVRRFSSDTSRNQSHNIGVIDRIVRVLLGVTLLGIAIMTTWSPWLLLFAGFCFFESIAGWCGLYAMWRRNTCTIR